MTDPEIRPPRAAWSAATKTAYASIRASHPALDPAAEEALFAALDLRSFADKMQAQVSRDGLTTSGSQGQPVAHPLIGEIRLHRRQSLDALRALGFTARSNASRAGATLASKRWSNRPPGVTPLNSAPSAVRRAEVQARLSTGAAAIFPTAVAAPPF